MTDPKAFELGVNIATTPGKVVFQNDLMQLIQYEPTTAKVAKRPLLIIPPWINKYYILDLREKNSFIKWAVDQGLTVFVISWVNPDEQLRRQGLRRLHARRAAGGARRDREGDRREARSTRSATASAARCSPRTLAYMAAKKDKRIASSTFMTLADRFPEPGELGVFIDEGQVDSLEKKMNERGYLEGSEMAETFNMLRGNDLIWSFVINNYLMGRDPFPFDLLHWNSDSTRMPAKMHSFYLRNMYLRQRAARPGRHHAGRRADRPVQGRRCRRISFRRWRTTSRRGRRPTRARGSCRGKVALRAVAAPATSPA